MSSKKSTNKKSPKVVVLKSRKARPSNPLHEKLLKLLTRPEGATMHDTWNAGFEYPAMAAVKIVERRGYKVSKKKEQGELTRYIAKKS